MGHSVKHHHHPLLWGTELTMESEETEWVLCFCKDRAVLPLDWF